MNILAIVTNGKIACAAYTTLSFVTYQATDTGEDCGGTVQWEIIRYNAVTQC